MFYRNVDIREFRGNIPNWIIAERLGVHENTFGRWMRTEMSGHRKQRVMEAIASIKKELEKEGARK